MPDRPAIHDPDYDFAFRMDRGIAFTEVRHNRMVVTLDPDQVDLLTALLGHAPDSVRNWFAEAAKRHCGLILPNPLNDVQLSPCPVELDDDDDLCPHHFAVGRISPYAREGLLTLSPPARKVFDSLASLVIAGKTSLPGCTSAMARVFRTSPTVFDASLPELVDAELYASGERMTGDRPSAERGILNPYVVGHPDCMEWSARLEEAEEHRWGQGWKPPHPFSPLAPFLAGLVGNVGAHDGR